MKSTIILEFKDKEIMECFISKRKLNVIEKGTRFAVIDIDDAVESAIKMSLEIGVESVRLALQFRDFKDVFNEYLNFSKIESPADFKVIQLDNGEESISLYYKLIDEAISMLPGLEISEIEPKAIYTLFVGKSIHLEIWGTNGLGGNSCTSNEIVGVFFTGSKDSFNISLNAIRNGYNLKLYYPYVNDNNLRNAIYLAWKLAKLGSVKLIAYREKSGPTLKGLIEVLTNSSEIKSMAISCKIAQQFGLQNLYKFIANTGVFPLVLGCLDEIKEFDFEKSKFNEELTISNVYEGRPIWAEVQANPSSVGLHVMLDKIIGDLNAG